MAHQDVVPVLKVTESRWKYPPYSAHYDGRYIWGRGATDCKNNLIGVLEAFEILLEKDFTPGRSILAGFGFDEEISGPQGAQFIAKHLEDTRGKDSIELIVDEEVWESRWWMERLLLCQGWAKKVSTMLGIGPFG